MQLRRRARKETTTATAIDNQHTALVSDFDSDSDFDSISKTNFVHSIAGLSNTEFEFSVVNHQPYQASFLEDLRIFEESELRHIQDVDSYDKDDSYEDEVTMIITPEALNALCSSSLTPLKELVSVQFQQGKVSIINGLICVLSGTHDHGYRYVLENEEYSRQQMGNLKATLPTAPTRPLATLDTSNHKQFWWENTIYNIYIGVKQAVLVLLQQVFPKSLVCLEVIPGMLLPLLKSKRALTYIKQLAEKFSEQI